MLLAPELLQDWSLVTLSFQHSPNPFAYIISSAASSLTCQMQTLGSKLNLSS